MLIDSNKLPHLTTLEADLCIVGGGAACMALCDALTQSGLSVVVLDSGGLDEDYKLRKALSGRNVGKHSFCLSGQRRALGGGMRDWSGNCSLLNEGDFASGNNMGLLDWPINFSELDRYTKSVEQFLKLDSDFAPKALSKTAYLGKHSFNNMMGLGKKTFIRSKVKLPADHLNKILKSQLNIKIITDSTVNKLSLNEAGTAIEKVLVGNKTRKFFVKAREIVLASGLENAPILLRTLGNPESSESHRLPALGRFLHSHLLSLRGFFIPQKDPTLFLNWSLPGDHGLEGKSSIKEFYGLQVPYSQRVENDMLNGVMFLSPISQCSTITPKAVHKTAVLVKKKYHQDIRWDRLFGVRHYIEQKPLWENRVSLKRRYSILSRYQPTYNWNIGSLEEHTMEQNLKILRGEMDKTSLGSVKFDECGESIEQSVFSMNAHPMGGTIMGDNPRTSVVDRDCSVHGLKNLYVVGGSVLPRGGAAMTTGVILQLAFRLAQHLQNQKVD